MDFPLNQLDNCKLDCGWWPDSWHLHHRNQGRGHGIDDQGKQDWMYSQYGQDIPDDTEDYYNCLVHYMGHTLLLEFHKHYSECLDHKAMGDKVLSHSSLEELVLKNKIEIKFLKSSLKIKVHREMKAGFMEFHICFKIINSTYVLVYTGWRHPQCDLQDRHMWQYDLWPDRLLEGHRHHQKHMGQCIFCQDKPYLVDNLCSGHIQDDS